MITATLNGRPVEVPSGSTILDACRSLGIDLPTLCHDDRFQPSSVCRLCLVRINGQSNLAPACSTPLREGMVIETATPELEESRRTFLELMAANHPGAPLVHCENAPFRQLLHRYNVTAKNGESATSPPSFFRDDTHPYIAVDMSRCIHCLRCVHICNEVQGQFVWHLLGRGAKTRVQPDGPTLLQSSCVSCGGCADTCPTGAIQDKSVLVYGSPTQWTRTTCPYCGVGCEMMVGTRANRIVQIKPALNAPVNKGHLCVKGRYAFEYTRSVDRITEPMIRRKGTDWKKVSWPEAIKFTADNFQQTLEKYGPDSVGVLGSARGTNEENYLAQKFARVVLGTNNVDCCARVCHAPTAAAMKSMLGTGAATNSFDDIEKAVAFLLCGTNATENHPIVGARIQQAVLRGAKLIVIDPRQIELARHATIHLPLKPGTNVPLLNAMACTIVEERLIDESALGERISAWQDFEDFIRSFPPEKVAEICGVDAELIRHAARLYATSKPAMCFHGLGVTEHSQGTEGVMCLVNLALLTGNFGKPGSGVNPLRGQNNVQGSAHMGCDPDKLTGYIGLDQGRALFEQIWRTKLPDSKGLNLMQMIDAAHSASLKALWAIGYDVALTNPNARQTAKALQKVDFVIVQDLFLNEIAREFGSVFLPAASSFEKDGTFMNSERRVQRVRKAMDSPDHAKADWEIVCELARAMGKGDHFNFHSPEQVWDEIRTLWPAGQGITYARLEERGLQWPCPDVDHPGTTVLHTQSFAGEQRAPLKRIEFQPTQERISPEFPFLLTTGRTLYQFNAGTMTLRTANAKLRPSDTLDISPDDARRLSFSDDELVRIRSRHGEAILPIKIDRRIKSGELFATFHTVACYLNKLVGPERDRITATPEYKAVAVSLEHEESRTSRRRLDIEAPHSGVEPIQQVN